MKSEHYFIALVLLLGVTSNVPAQTGTVKLLPHTAQSRATPCFAGVEFAVQAAAIDPYTVQLGWSSLGGKFSIVGSHQYKGSVEKHWKVTAPPAWEASPGPHPGPSAAEELVTVNVTHEAALPGSAYSYTVNATFDDGTLGCGFASVSTPPAIPPHASGTYTDVQHVTLTYALPANVHHVRIYRGLADLAVTRDGPPGQRLAGATGGTFSETGVDPGPPPFPYVGRYYQTSAARYPFQLEAVWSANADGTGDVVTLSTPFSVDGPEPILGFADMHNHQFAYLGFAGDPVKAPLGRFMFGKAFGPTAASLPWCTAQCGPGGVWDLADSMMQWAMYSNNRATSPGYPVGGDPAFDGWPTWKHDFTHQAVHETSLKRALDGGMKLLVVFAVNNEWMCNTLLSISPAEVPLALATGGALLDARITAAQLTHDPVCADQTSSENQIAEAFKMQTWIDGEAGGPGNGWYRIVTTPQQARDVIKQGKLAVVLGMEIDNLFGCYINSAFCNDAYVRSKIADYYARGVRHIFPVHFYDNVFGGSALANMLITSRLKNKPTTHSCNYTYYGGQCNAKGLTGLGATLINEMMKRGMLIDVDHMSAVMFDDVLSRVSQYAYPVVASHAGFQGIAWGDENNEGNRTFPQILKMVGVGGMFALIPHQGDLTTIVQNPSAPPHTSIQHGCGNSNETVAQAYLYITEWLTDPPIGFGSDFNGFAGWPGPRFGPDACPGGRATGSLAHPYTPLPKLVYPFTITASGVNITLDKGTSGTRAPYDFNVDGLAHEGMLPDMIADFLAMGMKPADLDPIFRSAEGYIRLWERATYIAPDVH